MAKKKTPPQYKTGPKKGQFKPRAKAPAKTGAKKKAQRKTSMAKEKKKTKRRSNPGKSFQKEAMDLMMGGAAYGYITAPDGGVAVIQETLQKVPVIGNRDISNGLALYFLNKHVVKNRWVRNVAMAALVTGATKFGQAGFALEGAGMGEDYSLDGDGDPDDDDAIDVTAEGEELSGIVD